MVERPDPSLLRTIFPPFVMSCEEVEGIHPEVQMYKQHFGGKAWPDVDRQHYERHTDAFMLMGHQTLKAYIGGYIDTILSDPDSSSCEFLAYFAGNQSFVDFCKVLNKPQIDFLIATLDWILIDDYFNDNDRERYTASRKLVMEHNRK